MSDKDSLSKRFSFRLVGNLSGMIVTSLTVALSARALGPTDYGRYVYLSAFMFQALSLSECGIPEAFFFKMSRHPGHDQSLRFFQRLFFGFGITFFVFVSLFLFLGFGERLWPGINKGNVLIGAVLAFATWFGFRVNQLVDALGFTVKAEKIRLIQRLLFLSVLWALISFGKLGLRGFLLYQTLSAVFVVMCLVLLIDGFFLPLRSWRLPPTRETRVLWVDLFRFSSPLWVASVILGLLSIIDRWVLQTFAGPIAQAFYGFGFQLVNIPVLFSVAMASLLTRDLSRAHERGDMGRLTHLFDVAPFFFFITAMLSGLLVISAPVVVNVLGGKEFQPAVNTLILLTLHPVFATYGQLLGGFLLATGATRLYRNALLYSGIFSLPLFWLIFPKALYGAGLGSFGLALKTIIGEALGINLILFFVARGLHVSLRKLFFHEVLVLCLCFGPAVMIGAFMHGRFEPLTIALFGSFLCLIVWGGVVWKFPSLLWVHPERIFVRLGIIKKWIYHSFRREGTV